MPLQLQELINQNTNPVPIKDLVSEEEMNNLIIRITNLPDFLKNAIQDGTFGVLFNINDTTQSTAGFDMALRSSNTISDFVKTTLERINNNYFWVSTGEEAKQNISDYVTKIDVAWTTIRNNTHLKYLLEICNSEQKVEGGFNSEADCVKLCYDFRDHQYDDINNLSCILAHELTHALDYNRDSKTYNSATNINSSEASKLLQILLGDEERHYEEEKTTRELITYTIQIFLADPERFKDVLLECKNHENYVELLVQSVNNYNKDILDPGINEFLEKIIQNILEISSLLKEEGSDSEQQTEQLSNFQDTDFIASRIIGLTSKKEIFKSLRQHFNQDELENELQNSNGPVGMLCLIQCLEDPAVLIRNWLQLSPEQQLEKRKNWIDKLLLEKSNGNYHIDNNTSKKIEELNEELKKVSREEEMERSLRVELDANRLMRDIFNMELQERQKIISQWEKKQDFEKNFSQLDSEFLGLHKRTVQTELQEWIDLIKAEQQALEQIKIEIQKLGQIKQIVETETTDRTKILYENLTSQETLGRTHLKAELLNKYVEISLQQISEFFAILKNSNEMESSLAKILLDQLEQIIRRHEERMRFISTEREQFVEATRLRHVQLQDYKDQLENYKLQLQVGDKRVVQQQSTQQRNSNTVPHYQKGTDSSNRKKGGNM